jgi:hypothetical protein
MQTVWTVCMKGEGIRTCHVHVHVYIGIMCMVCSLYADMIGASVADEDPMCNRIVLLMMDVYRLAVQVSWFAALFETYW